MTLALRRWIGTKNNVRLDGTGDDYCNLRIGMQTRHESLNEHGEAWWRSPTYRAFCLRDWAASSFCCAPPRTTNCSSMVPSGTLGVRHTWALYSIQGYTLVMKQCCFELRSNTQSIPCRAATSETRCTLLLSGEFITVARGSRFIQSFLC